MLEPLNKEEGGQRVNVLLMWYEKTLTGCSNQFSIHLPDNYYYYFYNQRLVFLQLHINEVKGDYFCFLSLLGLMFGGFIHIAM